MISGFAYRDRAALPRVVFALSAASVSRRIVTEASSPVSEALTETFRPSALTRSSPYFLSTVMSMDFEGTEMWSVLRPSSITLSSS